METKVKTNSTLLIISLFTIFLIFFIVGNESYKPDETLTYKEQIIKKLKNNEYLSIQEMEYIEKNQNRR